MVTNLAADVRAFTSNAFLVEGDRTTLVDPGANFDVVSAVEERTGGLDAVVLTHAHPDHVGNLGAVVEAFDIAGYGFDPGVAGVTEELDDGDRVRVGDDDYEVLHTPGHAPDHVCLLSADAGVLFAGDLVFANGGFGRTDLPGADRRTLIDSVEYLLERTPEDLAALHAGHGPSVYQHPREHVELAARAARET